MEFINQSNRHLVTSTISICLQGQVDWKQFVGPHACFGKLQQNDITLNTMCTFLCTQIGGADKYAKFHWPFVLKSQFTVSVYPEPRRFFATVLTASKPLRSLLYLETIKNEPFKFLNIQRTDEKIRLRLEIHNVFPRIRKQCIDICFWWPNSVFSMPILTTELKQSSDITSMSGSDPSHVHSNTPAWNASIHMPTEWQTNLHVTDTRMDVLTSQLGIA